MSGQVIAEKENGEGGVVHVLGTNIQLLDGARIDTSGAFGGGEVLIGGGFQGKDPDIKNAEHVFVSEDVEVKADALEEGDGGKVIFWGDKSMAYQGSASSRGGPQGGDGGLIEVSGKRLKFEGRASTAAPRGQTGTLLLDPTNVTITTADMGGSFSGCVGGTNTFTPDGAATDTINAATLVGLLNAPCNVTISTVGSGGGGTGAITVSSAVSWSAASTLTLTAASFVNITAAVTNTSASTGFTAMNFTANGVGATTNAGITLATGGVLTASGGNITLNGTSAAVAAGSHGVFFNGGSITTTAGNISVTGLVPAGVNGRIDLWRQHEYHEWNKEQLRQYYGQRHKFCNSDRQSWSRGFRCLEYRNVGNSHFY